MFRAVGPSSLVGLLVVMLELTNLVELDASTVSKTCLTKLPDKRKPGLKFPQDLPSGFIKLNAFMTYIHHADPGTKEKNYTSVAWLDQLLSVNTDLKLIKSAAFKRATVSGKPSVEQWVHSMADVNKPEYLYVKEQHDCVKGDNWTAAGYDAGNPINFPKEMLAKDFPSFNPRSIYDLILLANKTDHIQRLDEQGGDISYGLPYSQYISCVPLKKRNQWMEVRVIYADTSSGAGWNTTVRDAIPMSVVVFSYANTTHNASLAEEDEDMDEPKNATTPEYSLRYVGITASQEVSSRDIEHYTMPPAGTHCQNGTLAVDEPLPELPTVFSASVEVYSEANKRMDLIKIHYDGGKRLVGFAFNKTKDFTDRNLFTTGVTTKESGRFQVVHDYTHGLQYLQSYFPTVACELTALPSGVSPHGTGKVGPTGRLIDLKTPLELFFLPHGVEKENFMYAGVRRFLDMDTDVWCAEAEVSDDSDQVNSTVTIETYFTKDLSLMSGSGKIKIPQLLGVMIWRKDQTKDATWVTSNTYHIHNLVSLESGSLFWPHEQLDSCLRLANESFVAAEIKSPDWTNVVASANVLLPVLRMKLADVANVSVLRVQDVSIAQMPSNKPAVFFRIADKSGVAFKAITVGQRNETSLNVSLDNLNKTFAKGDLSVSVEVNKEKKTMTLSKNSFAYTNSFYSGSHDMKSGHSSGAMAGLALFMLIVGAGLGVGGAWYKWKRSQAGFQYHVYE